MIFQGGIGMKRLFAAVLSMIMVICVTAVSLAEGETL